MSLKSTEEFCVMTTKNDAKFEEEWTCRFKIYMRNLTNFDPSTLKSQTFSLSCTPFEQSIHFFELKNYRGVIFHNIE